MKKPKTSLFLFEKMSKWSMQRRFAVIFSVLILFTFTACYYKMQTGGTEENFNFADENNSPANYVCNSTVLEKELSSIPTLQIKFLQNDVLREISAAGGVANWFWCNGDGTRSGILTDSAHPLQSNAMGWLPVIDRTAYPVVLLDLFFSIPPDSITAKRWIVDEKGNNVSADGEYLGYTNVFVADKTIYIAPSDNRYVYEITADWQQPDFGGFVTYAFSVTNSAPVNAPRQTPLLYVNFTSEDLTQNFQALQLSNSWFPDTPDENGFINGGYCASSLHPLDVFATDWLAHLEWDEDAITIFLNSAYGEIELYFSDNFPPHTVYVRRWPAEFAIPAEYVASNMDLWFEYEEIEFINSAIHIKNDGSGYIYEIEAIWEQGRSSYTFRVESNK